MTLTSSSRGPSDLGSSSTGSNFPASPDVIVEKVAGSSPKFERGISCVEERDTTSHGKAHGPSPTIKAKSCLVEQLRTKLQTRISRDSQSVSNSCVSYHLSAPSFSKLYT